MRRNLLISFGLAAAVAAAPPALAWSPSSNPAASREAKSTRLSASRGFLREGESLRSKEAGPLKAAQVSSSDYTSSRRSRSSSPSSTASPWNPSQSSFSLQEFWMPVVSSALLITGNTFGAGSLVLPHLVSEPGLGTSLSIFGGAYLLNLMSGLTLANVAISQFENSEEGDDVPSSFQEFVQANLNSPELAMMMSAVSFGVNSLVLAFAISRVGFLVPGLDPLAVSTLWSAGLLALTATQTQEKMTHAASLCVMVLFGSFGSLLLPGLASLTNPLADLATPGMYEFGTSAFWHSVSDICPVILMCTIFQNIVPTIVKLQDYDRTKSFAAIGLGSFIPLSMYVAWCWACLGEGGIDLAATMSGGANPLLSIFSLATLAGSSIGCSLSCASEIDIFVKKTMDTSQEEAPSKDSDDKSQRFQLISVFATVGLPLGVNFAFAQGGDLTSALHLAGSVGSPLLYGVIPAMMAYKQMQQQPQHEELGLQKMGLGAFGMASAGMLFGNLMDYAAPFLPTAVAATDVAAMAM